MSNMILQHGKQQSKEQITKLSTKLNKEQSKERSKERSNKQGKERNKERNKQRSKVVAGFTAIQEDIRMTCLIQTSRVNSAEITEGGGEFKTDGRQQMMNAQKAFESIAKGKTADDERSSEDDTGMEPNTRVRRDLNQEVLQIQNYCVVVALFFAALSALAKMSTYANAVGTD